MTNENNIEADVQLQSVAYLSNGAKTAPNNGDGKRIDDLIIDAKLNEAMDKLHSFMDSIANYKDQLVNLQSRQAGVTKEFRIIGGINNVDNQIFTNQITNGLLTLVHSIKKDITNNFKVGTLPVASQKITSEAELIHLVTKELLIGHYHVLDLISAGSSGWIYKAKVWNTQKDVVLKVFKITNTNELPIEDLKRASNIKHRNLIKIIDYSIDRLPAYMILEYIDGIPLSKAINYFGAFPLNESIFIIRQLTEALEYVRKRSIHHSNIRPDKIFIDDEGVPMISSLDIIKQGKGHLCTLGRFQDDCRYQSPEALDEKLDYMDFDAVEKSDQFSLGLIFIEMLSGKQLFSGEKAADILKDRQDFFKNPSKRLNLFLEKRRAKKPLEIILKKMLAKEPADRYPDLSDVIHEIKRVKQDFQSTCPAQESVRLCIRKHHDLIEIFYENLMKAIPSVKPHFKNLNRQFMMFKFALDVILNIHLKKEAFCRIMESSSHNKYIDEEMYETFLFTLRDTIKVLLKDGWNETEMGKAWEEKIANVMDVVRGHLQNVKSNAERMPTPDRVVG